MKQSILIALAILLMVIVQSHYLLSQDVFLFSYFTGNGENGLHLAYSYDGRAWTALRNGSSFFKATVGDSLLRDPSIYRAEDGTFHMVWTTGWWNNGFGYASSKDLMNWTGQKYVRPMLNEQTTKNNWAPELFFDKRKMEYIICWSAWIPGRFPKTDSMGSILSSDPAKPKMSHRIYASFTKDFSSFTPAILFYDPGFNVIDATIVEKGGRYIMFFKDETHFPPQKNIRIATSDNARGPYGSASAPITGNYWAEGPAPFFVGDTCFVYFDKYRDHKYGAVVSTDFIKWTDISDQIRYPVGLRHGTVFKVPKDVLDRLLEEH
ncbi:MAG: glycoside hydrolase family 43 protein [Bacteroidota bacterium]